MAPVRLVAALAPSPRAVVAFVEGGGVPTRALRERQLERANLATISLDCDTSDDVVLVYVHEIVKERK